MINVCLLLEWKCSVGHRCLIGRPSGLTTHVSPWPTTEGMKRQWNTVYTGKFHNYDIFVVNFTSALCHIIRNNSISISWYRVYSYPNILAVFCILQHKLLSPILSVSCSFTLIKMPIIREDDRENIASPQEQHDMGMHFTIFQNKPIMQESIVALPRSDESNRELWHHCSNKKPGFQ